ncbi:MAG TPA: shikimate dehydrogenase [Pyrinomonadaceae bacterium]|jgi:3-dehydroquinate dehydratase/shikimate dehydrogenase
MNRSTLICVPVCVQTARELETVLPAVVAAGDLIELRLDCLRQNEFEDVLPRLTRLIAQIDRPTIITLRSAEQGGERQVDENARRSFWKAAASLGADYLDVESDLLADANLFDQSDWSHVIASHHDFKRVPHDLDQIYETIGRSQAHIIKIAVTANDVTDCLPVFRLLDRARKDGRGIIAIAMGESGSLTRILGPSRGAFLTYGAVEEGAGSAPGQIPARELRDVYRIDKITTNTQIVGLIGSPTGHSISPNVHNAAFEEKNLDAVYVRFEVHDLSGFMRRMVDVRSRELDWNLRGLSVTAPHKSNVIEHLDWIEPAAREIGAVNTIVIEQNKLRGYNTDAEGFLQPLLKRFNSLAGLRCAVIGGGGAARMAAWVLKREAAEVMIFARQASRAEALAEEFSLKSNSLDEASLGEFDLIVNATPVGTKGALESATVVTREQLRGAGFFYDLVYNPKETLLMRQAQAAGCQTLGGAEMLVTQAAAQFRLWTGGEAPIEVMSQAAEKALQRQVNSTLINSESPN